MKRNIIFYLFYCLFVGCKVSGSNNFLVPHKGSKIFISVENFPSRDTSSIIFYKDKVWFKLVILKNKNIKPPSSHHCHNCETVLTPTFFNTVKSIDTENRLLEDCTIFNDTIYNGKHNVSINNFYNISDLQEEVIYYKNKKERKSIIYLEPRLGINYCKENTSRYKFIQISNILRALD